MKGTPEVIDFLQKMLALEVHLNVWYRNMWRVIKHLGVKASAHDIKDLGTCAHKFVKILKDRLLYFDADTAYNAGEVEDQSTLTATFQFAQTLERELLEMGLAGIKLAVAAGDEATAEKLRHIEERHEDNWEWLDEQLNLISGMGEPLYISEHLKK